MTEFSRRSFETTTHAAISVVNAIPAGRGVAIGIDIPCTVKASIGPRKNGEQVKIFSKTIDPHNLVRTTVEYSLSHLHGRIPKSEQIKIQIRSEIPTAVGLKSSSAVSAATARAVFGLFSMELDSLSILKTSCRASKDSGASLTGAYDDASASLLGGLVFTDNKRFELIEHSKAPTELGSKVVILIPTKKVFTSSINAKDYARYRGESLEAFGYALEGEFATSMLLNSIIQCAALHYSIAPVSSALEQGASAAGITGKGPAVAGMCKSSKTLQRVKNAWLYENKDCHVVTTSIVQPEKLK